MSKKQITYKVLVTARDSVFFPENTEIAENLSDSDMVRFVY